MQAVHAESRNTAFSARISYKKIVFSKNKNRSVHSKVKLLQDDGVNICFCRQIGNVRAFGEEHNHNDR